MCDKFYDCEDGVATEKFCPDGLVFDPLNRKINKCDQPFNVDCGDRVELRKLRNIQRLEINITIIRAVGVFNICPFLSPTSGS